MSSDWQERSNKRRDERHTKEPEDSKTPRSRKNRKRWCGGHEGREHTLRCMPEDEAKPNNTIKLHAWYLVCTTCGRELDVWYERLSKRLGKPKPDWVTIPETTAG